MIRRGRARRGCQDERRDAGRRRSIGRSCPVPNYHARYFQSVAAAFHHEDFVTRGTRNGRPKIPFCRCVASDAAFERDLRSSSRM